MILARDSRCDNSQHARVPASRAHDDCRISGRIELIGDLLLRREEDLLLDFLAFAILFVEKFGKLRSFAFVVREKKL